jgi:hypothetical protein
MFHRSTGVERSGGGAFHGVTQLHAIARLDRATAQLTAQVNFLSASPCAVSGSRPETASIATDSEPAMKPAGGRTRVNPLRAAQITPRAG